MVEKIIFDTISMLNVATQKEIVDVLREKGLDISTRCLRRYIREINKKFIYNKKDYVIISNRWGTYISKNEKDIDRFIEENIRHAKSKLWTMYNIKKRMAKNKNMSFRDFINEHISEEEIDDE